MTSTDLNKINKPNTKLSNGILVINHHQINSCVKEIPGKNVPRKYLKTFPIKDNISKTFPLPSLFFLYYQQLNNFVFKTKTRLKQQASLLYDTS